jgi:hypothetical protein
MSHLPDPPKVRSAFTPMKPSNPVPPPHKTTTTTQRTTTASTGPQAAEASPAPTAIFEVPINLKIVAELPRSEPLMIRSVLSPAGERVILIQMASSDLLVGRALRKCDTTLIKFLVGAILCEYANFNRLRQDIQAVRVEILKIAGLQANTFSGLGLAGRIANSPFLKCLDTAAIFGPNPAVDTVELCRLSVRLREKSDLPGWQPRAGSGKENVNV